MTGRDLLSRFHDVVRTAPERIAVRDTAGALTFAELEARTAALAAVLAARGVRRGDRVGVSVPRGSGLLVSLLAVWRAGAAYVPLDPAYPADRLAHMATDAAVRTTVAPEDLAGTRDAAAHTDVAVSAGDAAYVIYTSGSTGLPKGVQATRGGVASLVDGLEQMAVYAAEPRVVAWNASVSFDASVQQWARVCRGDTIVVLEDAHRTEPAKLTAWLDECGVSDVDMTPTHWEMLREHLLPARSDGRRLRLFIGGEPISVPVWRELAGAGTVEAFNLYGPTECTVDATVAVVEGDHPGIGEPLPGNRLLVLDSSLREVPDGEIGELYIAGPRVSHGYLGRSGLTGARFLPDPSGEPGARMYRTGDLVRRTADGLLEFHGRADRQVKIRGHRVELGEIETVVRSSPAVAAAAVVVRDDLAGQPVAYYVPSGLAGVESLREHAAASLPEVMVPAAFVEVAALPLTPGGKLDTAALPAPPVTAGTAPEGEFERFIAQVWAEVLGRDSVSADDDFFALGGHSLVALRVVSKVKKTFGLKMSARDVYRHPRLTDLARHVESLRV
ncbi:non-ribosomal peptide synthetase [Lentzea albidocapillata]|uniref:Amino acid adenylation domain-containing protein n=1 Tax=Lentzea albidocapillata TaxID=40571 RepID=A0A1W1ZK35_9PSEU|nr:non-ribosomal peptide synthetase [Lentzea albidocapillata]SMC48766.1 amino acid adenylation domain-containing protein [Lentzea albidocapillata]